MSAGATAVGDSEPVSGSSGAALKRRVALGLARRFADVSGKRLEYPYRAAAPHNVLLPTVTDVDWRLAQDDLQAGHGGELRVTAKLPPKFCSVYSSAALVVNCFGPWRNNPRSLRLAGHTGFHTLSFEKKLPIFPAPRPPAHLDMEAMGPSATIAVESKLTEYMAGHLTAEFAGAYARVVEHLAHPAWRTHYLDLKANPNRYQYLDAAQLIKHYLGLKTAKAENAHLEPATLAYLYWEPANPEVHPLFAQHRSEITQFAEQLDDPDVTFSPLSYPGLWDQWDQDGFAHIHVAALRERYSITLDAA